ncbi:MAG: hypothetical protein IJX96_00420 [Clostridia bacterium]|nr:hypothetical protein [Clostridia bacterium]
MPKYSILTDFSSIDLIKNTPPILAAICLAALAIAFFIGFSKSVRAVGWQGITWLFASAAYLFTEYFLGEENPVLSLLEGWGWGAELSAVLASLVFALVCILIALLIFGALRFCLSSATDEVSDEGIEEYDKPSFFSRLFGGVLCLINTAAVLFTVLALALFLIGGTSLRETAFAPLFEIGYMRVLTQYVFDYALDILLIGLILQIAQGGYQTGFTASVRSLFVAVGCVGAVVFGFWWAFSRLDAPTLHKFLAGLGISVGGLLVVCIVNVILKAAVTAIEGVRFLQVADGAIAALAYLAIGVGVCAIVGAFLYTLGAYEVFDFERVFTGECLTKKLISACGAYVQPLIDRLTAMLVG